jgi:tRNA pseudouridine32 synthase/23S rRNA pseudouridine746 synthase
MPETIDLIYEDQSIAVVNKPAGLLSVPGRGADRADSVATRMLRFFPDALVVHRLDMATSGVLLFARGKQMQSHIGRMFRDRQLEKRYVAVVSGRPKDTGEVNLPICGDWPNRPRQKVDLTVGKYSLTRYRLLTYDMTAGISRIELEPVTGRTHQLRVHMAAIGHPVLGDTLYGKGLVHEPQRLLLHASMLSFNHPLSGSPLSFFSKPPF